MTASPLSLVFLGLSLSSSWGNGHATNYRALLRALAARGHRVTFLERDRPWYAENRDLARPDYCQLEFYSDLQDLRGRHEPLIASADAVVVGSYVPDGSEVARHVIETARGAVGFYDIDTPITLAGLAAGDCEYLTPDLIPHFDFYLSFTGGPLLQELRQRYRARRPTAFHCMVDPELYRPTGGARQWDLGYLGTYAADRQPALDALLLEPARRLPDRRFVVAGPQYPADIDWPANVERIEHLPPGQHARFYSSLGFALNITRAEMVRAGWSPSVRLFEAAACGSAILTDRWPGLDDFFPQAGALIAARGTADVIRALTTLAAPQVAEMADSARRIVLARHTGQRRAEELETLLSEVAADHRDTRRKEMARVLSPHI